LQPPRGLNYETFLDLGPHLDDHRVLFQLKIGHNVARHFDRPGSAVE